MNWKDGFKKKPMLYTADGTGLRTLQEEFSMPDDYTAKLYDDGVVDVINKDGVRVGSLTKERFDDLMSKVRPKEADAT
jgi:hypothetical protein